MAASHDVTPGPPGWCCAAVAAALPRAPMSRMLLSASTPSILVRSWLTTVSCTPLPSRTWQDRGRQKLVHCSSDTNKYTEADMGCVRARCCLAHLARQAGANGLFLTTPLNPLSNARSYSELCIHRQSLPPPLASSTATGLLTGLTVLSGTWRLPQTPGDCHKSPPIRPCTFSPCALPTSSYSAQQAPIRRRRQTR